MDYNMVGQKDMMKGALLAEVLDTLLEQVKVFEKVARKVVTKVAS